MLENIPSQETVMLKNIPSQEGCPQGGVGQTQHPQSSDRDRRVATLNLE
jgi:hypothetical protein